MRNWVSLLLAVFLCWRPMSLHGESPTPPDEAQRLVAQLDDPKYDVRRAAQLKLNSLGADALPVVRAAIEDQGALAPESLVRLKTALKYLEPRAKRETSRRAVSKWNLARLNEAYAAAGQQSPNWDDAARDAINHFIATHTPHTPDPAADAKARERSLGLFAAATRLGCKDPFVLCLYHMAVGEKFGNNEGPVGQPFDRALDGVLKGAYAPAVQFWTVTQYVRLTRRAETSVVRDAMKIFAKLARSADLPSGALDAAATDLYGALSLLSDPYYQGGSELARAYAAAAPGQAGPLILKGHALLDLAWRVHGPDRGRDVGPANWNGFNKYCGEAAEALEAAWKLDPQDARSAAFMITACLRDGGGGRDAMETWFARAMQADPDCREACSRKLYFLYPYWFGSVPDMVAFGRECLTTENWRGGIPMTLVVAHRVATQFSDDAKAYYQSPQVWEDLAAAYEGYLLNFPDDIVLRSEFAKAAADCGRWDVVHHELDTLGDRVVVPTFGSKENLAYYRRKAARLAGPTEP